MVSILGIKTGSRGKSKDLRTQLCAVYSFGVIWKRNTFNIYTF